MLTTLHLHAAFTARALPHVSVKAWERHVTQAKFGTDTPLNAARSFKARCALCFLSPSARGCVVRRSHIVVRRRIQRLSRDSGVRKLPPAINPIIAEYHAAPTATQASTSHLPTNVLDAAAFATDDILHSAWNTVLCAYTSSSILLQAPMTKKKKSTFRTKYLPVYAVLRLTPTDDLDFGRMLELHDNEDSFTARRPPTVQLNLKDMRNVVHHREAPKVRLCAAFFSGDTPLCSPMPCGACSLPALHGAGGPHGP